MNGPYEIPVDLVAAACASTLSAIESVLEKSTRRRPLTAKLLSRELADAVNGRRSPILHVRADIDVYGERVLEPIER